MIEELKLIQPGQVRVRIAPSPTGPMHIGLARTALFNYLFAKKFQGSFILRIEDTDKERSDKKYEQEIINGLKWLGLEYQEGPYYQSQRGSIYRKYLEKLLKDKVLYYCFCSEEELQAHRDYLLSIGEPPRYSEKCRELSGQEIENNLKAGRSYVLRFKTPAKKIIFEDMLRGEIETDTANFNDMVIAKSLEQPLYNFTAIIDDYEMKITHVIRGEDHISNTPKQLLIAQALNINPPKYLHLPLILGPDRSKLSKRHNAQSLLEYQDQGYLSEAMVNFLAFLGWNPDDEREIFSLASLVKEFTPDKLQKSGAVFNQKKLNWLNGFYIRQKSDEKLAELCLPYLIESGIIKPEFKTEQYPPAYGAEIPKQVFKISQTKEEISLEQLQNIIGLHKERLKNLSEIAELADFFFIKEPDYDKALLKWKNITEKEIKDNLDNARKVLDKIKDEQWNRQEIENVLMDLCRDLGVGDRGNILWPLRVALTGKQASAGPFEIAELLGKEKTLDRIKQARKKL